MKAFTKLSKKLQIAFVTGVFAFLFGFAGIFAASMPTQAYSCDAVNIVYCGLEGSTISEYITHIKKLSSTGTDGHFTDMRSMLSWGGYSESVVAGLSYSNTKVGTLYRSDGHIEVAGKTVATSTWISARFNGGDGFVPVKNGVWAREATTYMLHTTDAVLVTFDANGKAIAGIVVHCGNTLQFTPVIPPVDRSLECKLLDVAVIPGSRKVTATVTANPKNTTITNYVINWGDSTSSKVTTNTATHTFAADGTYAVKAYVNSADFTNVTSIACQKTVTVSVPKVLACVELKVAPTTVKNEYKLTAVANDAPVSSFTFNFGDGQTKQIATTASSASTTHVFQPGKSYNLSASVSGGTYTNVTSPDCQYKLDVPADKVPSVTITKLVNGVEKAEVRVNENFTYTLKVTNTGEIALTDVVVSDVAPAHVTFISTDKGTIDSAANALKLTIPSLAVDESVTVNITAKATEYFAGDIINKACVNAPQVNPSTPSQQDACDTATIVTKTSPAVTIVKTVNGVETTQVQVGETYTYEVTVKNTGNVALTGVAVIDTPETGIVLVASEGNVGTIANNKWTYTIPALAINESKSFKLTAKVTEYRSVALVNNVCVNANEVNPGTPEKMDACDDATVTVKVQNPNVSIVKTINGKKDTPSLPVGTEFTYEIVVKNTGEVSLTNVLVHDMTPAGIKFTGVANGSAGVIDATGKWSYTIPALAVGESQKFVINAKVVEYKPNTVVNVACVNAPAINANEPQKDDACDQANLVTPKEPEVLGETKETPPVLPNTGAASVLSLALGVSLISSVFYSVAQSRKLARG